jgi:Ca2+-transporting ATPase
VRVQALVRQLPAVETLGSVTTICSDKTGTLTRNRMQVQAWRLADPAEEALLREAALRCNDARARPEGWQGEPTEVALAEWACPAGDSPGRAPPARMALRRRASAHEHPDTGHLRGGRGPGLAVGQGRPGNPAAPLHPGPGPWLAQAEALAGQGMRVLALARRRLDPQTLPAQAGADEVERDLTLLGLVGLIDPPRPEAAAAVAECRAAGIRPVMITGDHPGTARAIAQAVGIVDDAQAPVLTGAELARMDDALLGARVAEVAVYARMDPAQKIRIVQALQARGEFVAMTGDGVNDAPALKAADIGVAMGLGGTDVAREASSLVLLDDHFATIVAAVREGRRIFDNIRKFIRYALTGNSGEIWVLFLAPLLGLPVPLLPIHILWVNLVTDGLPGLALAGEPAERG